MTLKLQKRNDLHIARKIWHVCGVFAIIWVYMTLPYNTFLAVATFTTSFVLLMDFGRLYSEKLNKVVQESFSFCMREGERNKISGMSYMAVGVLLAAILFPRDVVILALIFLGVGDPIASTFGILYGKNKIGSKSLEGSLAAFLACSIASVVYFLANDFFDHRIFLAVPLSGLWGALAELVEIKYLDDNFTLPILAGFGLWGLYYVLGA
ncbi:MAG: diacylglycerol/polyprenol kinase family protein [Bdellovibrionales bacterium]